MVVVAFGLVGHGAAPRVVLARQGHRRHSIGFCRTSHDPLQDVTDMKSLPDAELKSLATTPGPRQYLAFDEMARRIRGNPSGWTQQEEPWFWSAIDCTRGPNAREMEWAFLKWSQRMNDLEPELPVGPSRKNPGSGALSTAHADRMREKWSGRF